MFTRARRQLEELEDRHWWFRGRRAVYASLLSQHLGAARPLRALDVGGGSGGMSEALARLCDEVHVVERDERLASRSRERELRCARGDACALPYGDATFDLVCLFDVAEHIEDEQVALREAWRVLRPGGLLVLSGPAWPFLTSNNDRVAGHFRRFTPGSLRLALVRARFRVERCTGANTVLFPAIAATVLLLKLLERLRVFGADPHHTNLSLWIPRWLDALCYRAFTSELWLTRRFDLPFGHSLLAFARRPWGSARRTAVPNVVRDASTARRERVAA